LAVHWQKAVEIKLYLGDMKGMTVVKIVELIGSSTKDWEEATKNALDEAAKTIKNIKSVYVKRCNAKVENNKIVEYRAVVKIAFVVEREKSTK
jgi:flavin-binding protein dodecin